MTRVRPARTLDRFTDSDWRWVYSDALGTVVGERGGRLLVRWDGGGEEWEVRPGDVVEVEEQLCGS